MTKIDIKEYLSQFSGKEVVYKPNPGNAGDRLISYSTIQIMQELDIKYKIHTSNTNLKNKIILYGGGANLVPLYNYANNYIKQQHKHNKIIVLPHTISGNENLLTQLSDQTVLICREKTSFDYVKKIAKNITVHLSDDMAFCAKIPDNLKNNKMKLTGYCFRTDIEKTNKELPIDNKDFSNIFAFKWIDTEEHIAYGTHIFLNALSIFETIHTNRLHTAIAGILLGQQVHFYPNNYYKCRAVFDNSIKNKYGNVTWYDE